MTPAPTGQFRAFAFFSPIAEHSKPPRAARGMVGNSFVSLMHPGTDFIVSQEVFDDFQLNGPIALNDAAQIRPAVFPADGILAVELSQACHAVTPTGLQLGFCLHVLLRIDEWRLTNVE
jgi:hypothetical protein